MSEAMRDPEPYLQTWKDVLAQVLQEIAGSPVSCMLSHEAPADLVPPSTTDLWIVVTPSGGLRGEMSLRCSAASTVRLAQIFMNEPSTPAAEPTSEHRDAVLELLRQAGGLVSSALKPTWGEVQLGFDPAPSASSWPASYTSWLQLGADAMTAPVIEIQLSAALVAALHADPADRAQSPAAAMASAPASAGATPGPVNLDLLMDVELAVTLRFGSRQLLLREVLDLTPGAVVALDRQVEEPVDILLDGNVVARGEIVVLEGNYGLRVTEVAPAAS